MDNELLAKELVVTVLLAKETGFENLEGKISNILSDYSINKLATTLPSTGDGSATRYLLEEFLKEKMANNYSKDTLEQYFLAVKKLYEYTHKEVTLITKDDIINYLNYYRYSRPNKELKPNTIRNRYLQLSSFFTWLYVNKYIAENPFVYISTPKGEIPKKQIITPSEIEQIVISCEKGKKGIKLARDLAVISFFLDTGVRAGEFCKIKIGDINWEKNRVNVIRGKGNKSRTTFFGDRTKERLYEYLKYRDYNDNDYLFTHYYRNKPLSVSGAERIIKNIAQSSEILRLHPHLFRTSYVTNMISKGVAPNVVKQLLGHASLETLEFYVDLSEQEIERHITCLY